MRKLELEKVWTGDGLGNQYAVTLKQLKRTDTVALYQRTQKNGAPGGYEVFTVKVVEAGTPLPGGGTVEESYEQYPSCNRFGKSAWAPGSLGMAEKIYDNLVQGRHPFNADEAPGDDDDEPQMPTVASAPRQPGQRGRVKGPRPQLTVPTGEFSVKELAELNKVEYVTAFVFVKEAVEADTVKFVRSERRQAKGKETNLYSKLV